jgi:hypothetical protein
VLGKNNSRLFYHCYDEQRPTGGQKSVYQHVDALNEAGYTAAVVHTNASDRLRWFQNESNVMTWTECWNIFNPQSDCIVLPESMGPLISAYPGRKVIFNKNVYYGHMAVEFNNVAEDPYFRSDVIGVLAVSEHNAQQLRFAYPHQTICHVCEWIDPVIFRCRPLSEKKRRIVCIDKVKPHLASLHRTLYARAKAGLNCASDCDWVVLQGLSEQEVAAILGESLVFVFTGLHEGLGRAPLEAMLCGCITLGFSVGPMTEYLPTPFQFSPGDVVGLTEMIERILAATPSELSAYQQQVKSARELALWYSNSSLQQSVVAAWEEIFSRYFKGAPDIPNK